jgi:hypothetical protein
MPCCDPPLGGLLTAGLADDRGVDVSTLLPPALAGAVFAWLALTLATLVGRAGHDRRVGSARHVEKGFPAGRHGRRLLHRAVRHRSEAGKWRRIGALRTLVRARHPRSRSLLRRAIGDGDPDIAGAVARALGELGTEWAIDELVGALRRGDCPRSRVAAQLERFTPAVGARLVSLLGDGHGAVRFWAATLLAQCPDYGREELVVATRDADPNVRAAAVEALGKRRDRAALAVIRPRLLDEAWFVRVHACRAVGELGTTEEAPRIARLLSDPWWWVRAAAKDALRSYGIAVAGALIPLLDAEDGFARNGAAEVLQDVGFVDALITGGRDARLLERIFAAGGETMREAAVRRAETRRARSTEAKSA